MRTNVKESLKTIMLAIFLVVFVINLIGIQIGLIINGTILQPSFFIKVFKGQEAYAQIRQLMFRLVNRSLPNGQDSIPYLEEAISESWLEEEINYLLKNFYAFAKGKKDNTPTISFANLKKQVVDVLDDSRSFQDRTRLVQYWFDPLPDEVHLEDFMSIDFLWRARIAVSIMKWFPWVMCGIGLITMSLIYLAVLDWKQLILWMGSGIITAGGLLIALGLMSGWAMGHMSIIINMIDRLISFEIPQSSANNFIMALTNGIINPMNIIGSISIVIGGFMVYLIPIDERVLTLIK